MQTKTTNSHPEVSNLYRNYVLVLTPTLGIESLRWAMSIILLISVGSASLFFVAAKKIVVDLKLKR